MADTIAVRMPQAIRKRGRRRVVLSPDGSVQPDALCKMTITADPSLPRALGQALGCPVKGALIIATRIGHTARRPAKQ